MKTLHALHIEKLREENGFHSGNFVAFVYVHDLMVTYVGFYATRARLDKDPYVEMRIKARTVGGFHSAIMHDNKGSKFAHLENTDTLALTFIDRFLGDDAPDSGVIVGAEGLYEQLKEAGEVEEDDWGNPSRDIANLEATQEPTPPKPRKLDFHVAMKGYTFDDMETMIIQAASEIIVKRSGGEDQLGSKAFDMAFEKVKGEMDKWAENVLEITAMKEGDTAYTVKDMIAHSAEKYASEKVDLHTGEPRAGFVSVRDNVGSRLHYLVKKGLSQIFENEIDREVKGLIQKMKLEYREKMDVMLKEQQAKFSEALEKMSK